MDDQECQEDFTLTDYKVKKVSLWEKADKKKLLIITVILLLILLTIITVILIVVSLGGSKDEKEGGKEEKDEILPSIGEITCEYIVKEFDKNIPILGKDFEKKTAFQIIVNDKLI